MNLGTLQIKGLQALIWCIHDRKTNNQPLIADDFGQVAKRSVMIGQRIEKEKAETNTKARSIGKFKEEEFEAVEDVS